MKICYDLDGTIADLYGVENWLAMLRHSDPTPYHVAKPMVNLARLARYLNKLQKMGHKLCVISWLSKESTPEYDAMVTTAKILWLAKHMPSVKWDFINIVPYGTNKWEVCEEGILFDDDAKVRETWGGTAYEPEEMFEILTELIEVS